METTLTRIIQTAGTLVVVIAAGLAVAVAAMAASFVWMLWQKRA